MKEKSLLVRYFIFILLVFGCNSSPNLEEYGLKLIEQSNPGNSIKEFVGDSISLAPDKYLIATYSKLLNVWNYSSEIGNNDEIQSAEKIIESKSFIGDCEDFAVVIMALCRIKDIDAVFCLGKSLNNNNKGHIWVEVPICNIYEIDSLLQNRINLQLDSNLTTTIRDDTIWLQFIQSESLRLYRTEYIVDCQGKLRHIE